MQAARMNACVCVCVQCVCGVCAVCVRACELNLMSSARLTMRGNKVNGERKQAVIVLTLFWNRVPVWRGEKRDTCKEPHMQKSERRRKKDAGLYHKNAPPPLFFFYSNTYKGKKSELDLRLQPGVSASQLPGSF